MFSLVKLTVVTKGYIRYNNPIIHTLCMATNQTADKSTAKKAKKPFDISQLDIEGLIAQAQQIANNDTDTIRHMTEVLCAVRNTPLSQSQIAGVIPESGPMVSKILTSGNHTDKFVVNKGSKCNMVNLVANYYQKQTNGEGL